MGFVPNVYASIVKKFVDGVSSAEQNERISLYEYHRHGWTMHAKGLWYYVAGHSLPVMTMVGSSNFGCYARDPHPPASWPSGISGRPVRERIPPLRALLRSL